MYVTHCHDTQVSLCVFVSKLRKRFSHNHQVHMHAQGLLQKSIRKHKKPEAKSTTPSILDTGGRFSLSDASHVDLFQNSFRVASDEFDELLTFMKDTVRASPNPRNPKTFLKRKQCTFVSSDASAYHFGQHNDTFRDDVPWPSIVTKVLDLARLYTVSQCGVDASLYNGVHVNLYSDGSVGVNPHSDNETSLMLEYPIFSVTLLSDPSRPRAFSIYTKEDSTKLYDIYLGDGDILVMSGDMQKEFKHGVEASKPAKLYKDLVRMNLTIRAFKPNDGVVS